MKHAAFPGTEIELFPVKLREYHKPDDGIHEHLIEYFKTYIGGLVIIIGVSLILLGKDSIKKPNL